MKTEYFSGIYYEQMPLIVTRGMGAATAKEIAQLGLAGDIYFHFYYDTSTGIFYPGHDQDRFKILPFSKDLAGITFETLLHIGGIWKEDEDYEASRGREFTRKDMILGRRLTEKEALSHAGWLASFDRDEKLLERFVQRVFKDAMDRYGIKDAMGFDLRDTQGFPSIRALFLVGLEGASCAHDGHDLYSNTCLVGLYEESAKALRQKVLRKN